MDPLSVTVSIIAILQLSAEILTYLNDVKDASKDRAQCAIEASNLYSLLLNLRFRLEDGDASQPWYTTVRALAVENGPLDQFKQALETLRAKMTDGGRLKRAGTALMWKFKKEEIASILARMERLKTLVEIALQMDNFKLPQAIKDDTSFVRMHVLAIQTEVNTMRQDQDSVKHRRLLDWISSTDYPVQQSDIIKRRQKETGQWFLDAPEMAQWLRKAKTTLFCLGIPGAGKTMIAAIAIDYLLNLAQDSLHGIAYVYCSYKTRKEQDASSILAAILKQLIQGRPSIVEPVERLYQQHATRGTKPSLDEIFSVLRDVLAHYPVVYVVIDALDECRDTDVTRRHFLSKIRDLQAKGDVRLMVTSRYIPEIMEEFRGVLKLEVRASNEDVKRFVAGQTYGLPKCVQRDLALQDLIQERIVEVVDGMFLLARLHTDSLLDKKTPKDIKSTLAQLTKGSAVFDTAYRDALQRIEGQLDGDCERAKKVLSWITFAKRPLTTAEICCALAIEAGEVELDPENIADVEDLVSVCAGLVIVDPESAVIRLVHYTTQEYFERIRNIWNPSAQLDIATKCLTYLSFGAFRSGSCSNDREFEERLRQNQFLDYAAKHWGYHARAIETEVSDLACSFLLENGSLSCAEQVLLAPSYRYGGYSQNFPAGTHLHFIAGFGLSQTTQKLLTSREDGTADIVNVADNENRAALSIAAEHGHDELVKLLLDEGADINAQGGSFGNALQAASCGGHKQIVKLLLDKGAEVNSQGGDYGNALQAASCGGHKQIVKLLLDKGADINAQGGSFDNALRAASHGGDKHIVKLLLDKGAEVNAQGGLHGSFLQLLAYQGQTDLLRLVYEQYHADQGLVDSHGRSPLLLAARGGHLDTFNYLVNLNLETNIEDEKGDGLIHYAASNGSLQILNAVLHKQPTPTLYNGHWSPLHWACRGGNPQVVERLVQEGFRSQSVVLSQPKGKWSLASIATFHGNGKMLEQLTAFGISLPVDVTDYMELTDRRHGRWSCNGCFHNIYGPRFCCCTCVNFDYCFMCKPFLDHLHKNHDWDYIEYHDELPM